MRGGVGCGQRDRGRRVGLRILPPTTALELAREREKVVLLEAGRAAEAETQLRAALTLIPPSADAHNNLGIALGSQGRLQEALAQFERALAIDPSSADALRNLQMAREGLAGGR